jgi:hypothetical protein
MSLATQTFLHLWRTLYPPQGTVDAASFAKGTIVFSKLKFWKLILLTPYRPHVSAVPPYLRD